MRPSLLSSLFAPARSLKGVGPRIEGLLNKLVAPRHQSAHARVIDFSGICRKAWSTGR